MHTTRLTSSRRRSISASVRSSSAQRLLLVVAGVDQHDAVAGLQRPCVHVGNAGPRQRQSQPPDAREHAVGTAQPVPAVRVAHAREPTGSRILGRVADVTERVPDGVTLVRAPNAGPMTLSGTNTWLIGAPAWVIDPGPADAGARRAGVAGRAGAGRDRGHRADAQPPRSLGGGAGAAPSARERRSPRGPRAAQGGFEEPSLPGLEPDVVLERR